MEALEPKLSVSQSEQVHTSDLPETLAAALFLHRQGLALLPIRPGTKEPHTDVLKAVHGSTQWGPLARRRASEPEVTAWFEKDPGCGIGVIAGQASGGLAFVDVDDSDAAGELVNRFYRLGGPVVVTPRPGFRFLFRQREPIPNRPLKLPDGRKVGEVITGYNTRREPIGQYSIVPPSVHPSGRRYWWLSPQRGLSAPLPELDADELDELLRGAVAEPPADAAAADADAEASPPFGRPPRKYERSYLRGLESEASAMVWELQRSPKFIEAALRLLGLGDVGFQRSFRCILPGHDERKASATLFQLDDGGVLYCDWHERHGEKWFTLAEVYAAKVTGKVRNLRGPEHCAWILRLAVDAGVIEPARVEAPEPPADLPPAARLVYEGFLHLLRCKWLYAYGQPSAFSWRFAQAWCGVSEWQVRTAMQELLRRGLIRKVGEHKPASGRPQALFLPGLVARAGGVKDEDAPARPWARKAVKNVLRAARVRADKPSEPCAECGGTRFWTVKPRAGGRPQWVCESCLPPPHERVVWCRVSAPPPA